MKKLSTLTLLLIGLIGFSQEEEETIEASQSKKWYIKAGVMMSSVSSYHSFGNNELSNEAPISPYIGIGGRFGEKIIFQPELLITHYSLDIGGSHSEFSNSYYSNEIIRYNGGVTKISIPLIIKYEISTPVALFTGISTSALLINKDNGVKNTSSSFNGNSYTDTKTFDRSFSWNPAIIFGFEYELNSNLSLEARFNYSPEFIYDISEDSNIYISSNIGIREKNNILIGANYTLF